MKDKIEKVEKRFFNEYGDADNPGLTDAMAERIAYLEDLIIRIQAYEPFSRDLFGPCNGSEIEETCPSCETFLLEQEIKELIKEFK